MTIRTILAAIIIGFLGFSLCADPVKLGVFPSNDPVKLQQVMDIFAEYLSRQTGDEVSAVITQDYNELAKRLEEGSIDIAWINTLNYVKIKNDLPGIRYLATYMEKNEISGSIMPYYQSYIVSLNESPYAGLDQLENTRFAFTDPGSTSGYAYPNLILRKNGIDPENYFGKVFFLKRHDRVVEALRAGSIDAGAMSDGTYFTAEENYGDILRIIAKSDPIPLDAIVAVEEFPESKMAPYRDALLSMPADHRFCREMKSILGWSAAGFDSRDDGFYDSVREALGL